MTNQSVKLIRYLIVIQLLVGMALMIFDTWKQFSSNNPSDLILVIFLQNLLPLIWLILGSIGLYQKQKWGWWGILIFYIALVIYKIFETISILLINVSFDRIQHFTELAIIIVISLGAISLLLSKSTRKSFKLNTNFTLVVFLALIASILLFFGYHFFISILVRNLL